MKRVIILLFPIFILSVFSLSGQENLSMAQAIEIGLQNNYQIQIAQKDLEIAQNNNNWAIAGRYPSVDLSVGSGNTYNQSNNPASFIPKISTIGTNLTPAAEASMILFDGYRVRFTKEQLEELERLSEGNVRLAIENTVQTIILAYYAALVQKEQLDVLTEVLKLSSDRINYEEVKKQFGQAGTFDILQTKDAYFNDSTNYITQKNTYENALRTLNLAMAEQDLNKPYTLTDKLQFSGDDYDLNALRTKMLANNVGLQNLFVNRELAAIGTKIESSTKLPTVSIRGGAAYTPSWTLWGSGTRADGAEFDLGGLNAQSTNAYVNFAVTYNLYNGGTRKRKIENARKEELITQLNIEDTKLALNAQLENTWATYNMEKEVVKVTQELMDNAEENIRISDERFRGGLITSFEYRTVQLNYINASVSRLTAIFNLKNTETELIRLIGGLVR